MLKALELSGFKSFADRTRLEFPSGVTAVVGPNGSGKSNVVDSIKWVLGSQSAKALRGSEMTDVIFNGSTSRRPVNMAEVSLEFDNTSGLFPAGGPIAEGDPTVRLTRRVYRSGEGEYLINGTTARLRDFRSLMAGTGLGSQGGGSYGIIEQGRVDAVLQASPPERRALFEEAAGISRFRLKKVEAARRLARVEQNLLRLSDIVDEVEGRLRRVRAQAGKAQRYREQAGRLKQLRTELGLADWRALTTSLEASETRSRDLATKLQAAQSDLDECETALETHQQQSETDADKQAEAERRLADVREEVASRVTRLAEESKRLVTAEQAIAEAGEKLLAMASRPATSVENGHEPVSTEVKERLEAATLAADEAVARAAQATAAHEAARDKKQHIAEQLRAAHRDAVKSQERLSALSTAEQEAAETVAKLIPEASTSTLAQATAERDAVAVRVKGLLADAERAAGQLTIVRNTLAETRDRLIARQKELALAEAELLGVEHRRAAIEQFEQKLEKLAVDIRGVLNGGDAGGTPTVHGMVADLLHVDYDTAPMIEAALGDRAQHLVVDTADRLVAALAGGEASLRVRASFQRLDAKTPTTALDRVDLSAEPGVMGRADTFVDSDRQYEPLVKRLLARTWFVDSLATAARLSTGVGRGLSFVTYQGELLSADGGIFVGPKQDQAGLITSRRHASELQDEHDQIEARAASIGQEVAELEAAVAAATTQEQSLFGEHTTVTEQLAAGRQQLAGFQERVVGLTREAEQRQLAHAAAEERLTSLRQELETVREEAAAAAETEQRFEMKLAHATEHAAAIESELTNYTSAATDARVTLAKVEHDFEAVRQRSQQHQQEDSEYQQLRIELESQRQRAVEQQRTSELTVLRLRAELAERYLERDALTAATRGAIERRQHEQQLRRRGAERAQQLRDLVARLTSQAQRSELQGNQQRLERQTLAERMQGDYGIDLAAVAAEQPDASVDTPVPRQDLQRELEQLRQQVQAIGPVNSDALEELDDLQERFEQLSGQYKDLSAAKASLARLTSRINADSRELFQATIDTVRGHFRELFRRLFGGGEADLVLLQDEDEDLLEAGVEIVAQPPGKELSSISLLSGGERTMTCVALLLALFRTKPSPFCVLDEVDAALDEANIGRFTTVLTEFLASTQFLVITHSKKTMMGADTIYGVTMQEPGISTRVGVRFEDVGEDGQLRVSSAKSTMSERRAA